MNVILPNLAAPGAILPPLPLPAGAAAAAAAPPLAPVAPGPLHTFAKLYNTPTADAHAGAYGPTTEPAAGQNTPAEIWTILDNAQEGFLQAYLLLGSDRQAITIHTVTHYPMLPGAITPWDGLHFGFVGDVVGHMVQPVKFPAMAAFDLVAAV